MASVVIHIVGGHSGNAVCRREKRVGKNQEVSWSNRAVC